MDPNNSFSLLPLAHEADDVSIDNDNLSTPIDVLRDSDDRSMASFPFSIDDEIVDDLPTVFNESSQDNDSSSTGSFAFSTSVFDPGSKDEVLPVEKVGEKLADDDTAEVSSDDLSAVSKLLQDIDSSNYPFAFGEEGIVPCAVADKVAPVDEASFAAKSQAAWDKRFRELEVNTSCLCSSLSCSICPTITKLLHFQMFKLKYGHCNVPQKSYKSNPSLGRWLAQQRSYMRKSDANQGELEVGDEQENDRMSRLKQLGVVFYIGKSLVVPFPQSNPTHPLCIMLPL